MLKRFSIGDKRYLFVGDDLPAYCKKVYKFYEKHNMQALVWGFDGLSYDPLLTAGVIADFELSPPAFVLVTADIALDLILRWTSLGNKSKERRNQQCMKCIGDPKTGSRAESSTSKHPTEKEPMTSLWRDSETDTKL